MKELVELEEKILLYKGKNLPDDLLKQAKKDGFSDRYLSLLLSIPEKDIRGRRIGLGCKPELGCRAGKRGKERSLLLLHLQWAG